MHRSRVLDRPVAEKQPWRVGKPIGLVCLPTQCREIQCVGRPSGAAELAGVGSPAVAPQVASANTLAEFSSSFASCLAAGGVPLDWGQPFRVTRNGYLEAPFFLDLLERFCPRA